MFLFFYVLGLTGVLSTRLNQPTLLPDHVCSNLGINANKNDPTVWLALGGDEMKRQSAFSLACRIKNGTGVSLFQSAPDYGDNLVQLNS